MEEKKNKRTTWNKALLIVSLAILGAMYLFQQFNFLGIFLTLGNSQVRPSPYFTFIFNKTLRFLINDGACFILIFSLFERKKFLKIAGVVFLIELLILLPIYFVMKYLWEGDSEISSPLLSQLHRLIINPTLMIMLIVAFYYQMYKNDSTKTGN